MLSWEMSMCLKWLLGGGELILLTRAKQPQLETMPLNKLCIYCEKTKFTTVRKPWRFLCSNFCWHKHLKCNLTDKGVNLGVSCTIFGCFLDQLQNLQNYWLFSSPRAFPSLSRCLHALMRSSPSLSHIYHFDTKTYPFFFFSLSP